MEDALSHLLSSLNEEQYHAVHPTSGTMLVCAGAGSGKTRIIIARIAYLLYNGVSPSSIIAVTFTNKAAREMKERLHAILPHHHALPYIGTFHGFCLYTLKKYASELGLSDFSLLDEGDQRKLVQSIIKRSHLDSTYKARNVVGYISHRKNSAFTTNNVETHEILEHIYNTYEQEKARAHCFDFDDLLLEVAQHLNNNDTFRHKLHAAAHHILIDEYQDTNHVQHELLKLLAQEHGSTRAQSVCVVGDEDQSIYRWRGASIENFVNFETDFPETQRITITRNYRSCRTILDAANTVISHNSERYVKHLWSDKPGDNRLLLAQCASHIQEGHLIAHAVGQSLESGYQPGVLYRSHHQSRSIEEALMQRNIPYTIIGGTEFYQRQEVKDILAYLKLLINPYDHISWSRICNIPARGLGAKFQEQFLQTWREMPFADHHTVAAYLRPNLPPRKAHALSAFTRVLSDVSPDQPAYRVCHHIIESIDYKQHLHNTLEHDEAHDKIENINELERALATRGDISVRDFLEEITLMQSQNADNTSEHQVQLMTLHAAKGLEFHTVVIAGLEEHVFPSTRARNDDASLEEERRLFYVGLTRAQEYVLMTYAQYRSTFGTINDNPPSRFISELPEHTVQHMTCTHMHDAQVRTHITQWLSGTPVPTYQQAQVSATEPPQGVSQHAASTTHSNDTTSTAWKRGDRVSHTRFGTGTIHHVWRKGGTTYLMIKFGHQIKKLDARFISKA